jgi:YjjG family noncanonical pyrimidine nucleotidase
VKYKILLLDLDNTLFDFSGSERLALRRVLTEQGVEFRPEMAERYGRINDECWKMLEREQITKERLIVYRFERFLSEFSIGKDAAIMNRLYMEAVASSPLLLEGALPFLEKLKGRYRLYAVTNGTAFVQKRRLALSGIDRFFEEVFISEELGVQKPSPLFFERATKRIPDFSKEWALVVGDSLSSDMQGAENFGLDAMWFNPCGKENETGLRPRYTVSSYGEAEKILNV